jgi:predicted O-methyltransferase YrrM
MMKKEYLYRVNTWLKHHLSAWNTGGEGVHSPYLFEWVRMIMADPHAYYIWNDIENLRKEMLSDQTQIEFMDYGSGGSLDGELSYRRICDVAKSSLKEKKYAQMMFRLVNWLGHQLRNNGRGLKVVELGTSLGITTAYLAGADRRDVVYTYEGCKAIADRAKENWKALGMSNIDCRLGRIDVGVLERELDGVDLAFIDANHTYEATLAYFDVLASKMHEKSVMVIDDIHHSREMECAWKNICADARVTSAIDLYQMGLVFFDKHYWKRTYRMRV